MTAEPTSIPIEAAYRDPRVSIPERVADLLGRMTLAEKVAQLGSAWVFQLLTGKALESGRVADVCPDGVGQITRLSGASDYTRETAASVANQIQRQLIEDTRLGIPAIVHEEICSGLMGRGSTVFPQAIGVAATFDPVLNEKIGVTVRRQMRASGSHQGLSPVLDVCRDPRWGRTEETYGEDPHLVASMGAALVDGLQGPDPSDGVIATAKHFVGYGISEGGMNWAPAHIADRELREVFLYPFEVAVRDHGLKSVMNGYHELDGVPCAAAEHLMQGVLRGEWGFDGTVVSDYFSVSQLDVYHHVVSGKGEAAVLGLRSGIDVELPATDCYGGSLVEAAASGAIDVGYIDDSVRRVLTHKFELGLFEHPYVDERAASGSANTRDQRDLARLVAAKSLVLLRNDGVLPLGATSGTIAVIGPNADAARNLYGDYSYPSHVESLREMSGGDNVFDIPVPDDFEMVDPELDSKSVLETLRGRFGDRVVHAPGCGVLDDDRSGFDAAVDLARKADVVVLVVGDKAGLTDDSTSGESRDRSSLDLPGVQEELAAAVMATGTPVITVLVVGRPCGSEALHLGSAAVLLAWLPGQEGADAIVDAIAGDVNPGGKLPMTYPRSAGQVPVFYGHKVSGGRSHWKGDYVDAPSSPLYPFGFGSSYTTFAVSDVRLESATVSPDGTAIVHTVVTNTGPVVGDEVLQLYIANRTASVTRPVVELKAFTRVTLGAGDSVGIRFEVPIGAMGFYDGSLEYVVESGPIEILIGTSSTELVSAGEVWIESGGAVPKLFGGTAEVR